VLAADLGSLEVVSIVSWCSSSGSTYGDSVDPNHVCAVDRDRITSPDVVRVQLGDLDVLDDDVVLNRVRSRPQNISSMWNSENLLLQKRCEDLCP
jgi:hypothetical protein